MRITGLTHTDPTLERLWRVRQHNRLSFFGILLAQIAANALLSRRATRLYSKKITRVSQTAGQVKRRPGRKQAQIKRLLSRMADRETAA
jgi:hypothetical protein